MKNLFVFICLVFATQTIFGQAVTVKGTVSDNFGSIIGATISVEGTQIGTVTGIDNGFSCF